MTAIVGLMIWAISASIVVAIVGTAEDLRTAILLSRRRRWVFALILAIAPAVLLSITLVFFLAVLTEWSAS